MLQSWLNPNTFIALMMVAFMVLMSLYIRERGKNHKS
jgi:hypothetical protein